MKEKEKNYKIGLVGLSHKTAPVELRELFSLKNDKLVECMGRLHSEVMAESVCLSTCNRTEIYFASGNIHKSIDCIMGILEEVSSISRERLENYIYRKYSRDVVTHLFAVSSSLDSMVIGEDEILGQVKRAYKLASEGGRTGLILNRLFHHAFRTAKRIRTETEIARNPISIAYIATELARSIFDDLSKRKALLIGAGEMGELILKYFTKFNIGSLILANRSLDNAERIAAGINGQARIILLDEIKQEAGDVDIIISSVSSMEYVIHYDDVKAIVDNKGDQSLFMIDISVPRSIDPESAKIKNAYLYNVDDLKTVADDNLKNRLNELELSRRLIESEVEDYYSWYEGLDVVPAIIELQKRFDEIRKIEIEKYKRKKLKHISEEDFATINEMTNQIMVKFLHNPITFLKNVQSYDNNDKAIVKDITKLIGKIFKNM